MVFPHSAFSYPDPFLCGCVRVQRWFKGICGNCFRDCPCVVAPALSFPTTARGRCWPRHSGSSRPRGGPGPGCHPPLPEPSDVTSVLDGQASVIARVCVCVCVCMCARTCVWDCAFEGPGTGRAAERGALLWLKNLTHPGACRAHIGSAKVPEKPVQIPSRAPVPATGWFWEAERSDLGTGPAIWKTGPSPPRPPTAHSVLVLVL